MPADELLPRRTRVAAYALCLRDDAVLLTRLTADRRTWTLPGGGVEFAEHPAAAVVREVAEETGLEVALAGVLGVDSIHVAHGTTPGVPPGDYHGIRIVWRAEVVGGSLRHETAGSTDRAAWVPLADVPGLATVELVDVALGWVTHAPAHPAEWSERSP